MVVMMVIMRWMNMAALTGVAVVLVRRMSLDSVRSMVRPFRFPLELVWFTLLLAAQLVTFWVDLHNTVALPSLSLLMLPIVNYATISLHEDHILIHSMSHHVSALSIRQPYAAGSRPWHRGTTAGLRA